MPSNAIIHTSLRRVTFHLTGTQLAGLRGESKKIGVPVAVLIRLAIEKYLKGTR